MPRTTTVNHILHVQMLRVFNSDAANLLEKAFREGKKIEKVESTINDPGKDCVKFMLEGKEVCTIDGY